MTLAKREGPVGLLKVEEARALLAECKRIDEAKSIRDKAEAIRVYLRNQKASADAQNDAAEIKLRAERRLGELLEPGKERRGGKSNSRGGSSAPLPDGVTHNQSKRWQDVARVPEDQFEAHLRDLRRAGERVTTAALTKELRRADVLADIAEQAQRATPIADVRPCPVVYADPPWEYENTASAGAAASQYPTMPLADICALEVPATDDAILFLWATAPLLEKAFEVIGAWGFSYKGVMVWDKGHGVGSWVLNACEFLLIAVRGNIPCPAPSDRPISIVHAPATEHSRKPEEFAKAIERMYPGLQKIEMFARRAREGWTVWGNQAA